MGTFTPGLKPRLKLGLSELVGAVGAMYLLVKSTPEPVFVRPIPDGVVDAGY